MRVLVSSFGLQQIIRIMGYNNNLYKYYNYLDESYDSWDLNFLIKIVTYMLYVIANVKGK
jgi:hypothetical protein